MPIISIPHRSLVTPKPSVAIDIVSVHNPTPCLMTCNPSATGDFEFIYLFDKNDGLGGGGGGSCLISMLCI